MNTDDGDWNEWLIYDSYRMYSHADIAALERRGTMLGLNAWEALILESIACGFGQVPSMELLTDRAFGTSQEKNSSKATQAIERCFGDGFIQFLTADFLLEMKAELDAGGYLQPSGLVGSFENDIDSVGLISFTHQGVDLYHKWVEFDPATSEHWTLGPQICSPYEILATSEEWCMSALPSHPFEYVLEGPAVPIGRWSDRWWNRFERGWRLTYSITNETGL